MAMYLNTVSYGHHAYGIKSAARTFFNKSVDSLNLQESRIAGRGGQCTYLVQSHTES